MPPAAGVDPGRESQKISQCMGPRAKGRGRRGTNREPVIKSVVTAASAQGPNAWDKEGHGGTPKLGDERHELYAYIISQLYYISGHIHYVIQINI